MATRKHAIGPKHNSRLRYQSNDNRRRLSKQEEIDLTVETIDLNEPINENNGSNNISVNSNETSITPITIHVNSVEDKCDAKIMETDSSDSTLVEGSDDSAVNGLISMHSKDSNSGQSSFRIDLDINQANCLSTDENRKRGKQLMRAEAVRDTSISPPLHTSDVDEKNMLSVNASNSQSQIGCSLNSQNKMQAQGSSQGSIDRSSPCLSRDSSTENYSDSTGTDLLQFLTDTLRKNKKDRMFLLKMEQDLSQLVKDSTKTSLKFPQMTSYNRMLVHRIAAFFGFDHNVDTQGTSVVIDKTKNTRIPDMKFGDYIKDELLLHEPKKSILKRDSASLEDGSGQVGSDGKERSPDRQTGNFSDGSRSKSFEEREASYEKARARIFNQDSSSSTEGNDGTTPVIADNIGSNNCGINSMQSSSLRSSQEDVNSNWTQDQKAWSSTDSDSSGRLHKNESKQTEPTVLLKAANSSDSDTTPKSTTLSSSSSSCGMNHLTPDGYASENNNSCQSNKNKEIVTKANSFSGISHNVDNSNNCSNNSNSTPIQLKKSDSMNLNQNMTPPVLSSNNTNSNASFTPKTCVKQDISSHKSHFNNTGSVGHQQHNHQQQQQQRYKGSQPTSQHNYSSTSHHNRPQWHPNHHQRHVDRVASINSVQWPPVVHQNYPQFLLHQQLDANVNNIKDCSYLQSGQQYFMAPVNSFGQQSMSNEHQQQLTQPFRLVYGPNQHQMQNIASFATLVNNSVQSQQQTLSSQVNHVPYQLQQSSQSIHNYSNPANVQNSSTGFNPVMNHPSGNHSYGTHVQMPSGVGTVWIINNGSQPNSGSPLLPCPTVQQNTPPTPPISANIAPFVGQTYQQCRPTINSNINPNVGYNAAHNRPHNSLLKSQPLLATQAANAGQRILPSNGNHFVQQVPELMDMNLLGANNYMNRSSIIQNSQLLRRMPLNPNQSLDVRLNIGSQQSSHFLLPTPQRPVFPLNNFNTNRYQNPNQRSKSTYAKYNNKQRNNPNNKNMVFPNAGFNGTNT